MFRLPYDAPLLEGTLVRRYKRFLVDVKLRNGHLVVAHTPNTGSMAGCSAPGSQVYLSRAPRGSTRKLRYTLELVRAGQTLVGVNTLLPNRLVAAAVRAQAIPELRGRATLRREVAVGRSRLDLVLGQSAPRCYVEIKNVTLMQQGVARFPDAATARGQRHLEQLRRLVQAGERAVIFFLVQREDCHAMGPADAIDPRYGELLRQVVRGGVEPLAYQARLTPRAVTLTRRLPVVL